MAPNIKLEMRKAYLETSAINYAQQKQMTGNELRLSLEKLGYSPVIGIHAIYELARVFLGADNVHKGTRLFSLIEELDPSVMPPVRAAFSVSVAD